MSNTSTESQKTLLSYFLRFKERFEAEIFGFFGGAIIGVGAQPFANRKRIAQQAENEITWKEIHKRIIAPRIDFESGRIICPGGLKNYWTALPWGIWGSMVKQTTKVSLLVEIEKTDLPLQIKASLSAFLITTFMTPFDRISNSIISAKNKHLAKTIILKKILMGGPTSWYKGAVTDLGKNGVEMLAIQIIYHLKENYKNAVGRKLKLIDDLFLSLIATSIKLGITQPWDGIKAYKQQHLDTPNISFYKILKKQGLYKIFTAGLLDRFILNYLSIVVSFLALNISNQLRNKTELEQE